MTRTRRSVAALAALLGLLAAAACTPASSVALPQAEQSTSTRMDPVGALRGFSALWKPSGTAMRGTVLAQAPLRWNDRLASWINQHATPAQRFRALQDAQYRGATGGYDQSMTIADGLGQTLGALYLRGRRSGALPLVSALVDTSTGAAGAHLGTGAAKAVYAYPRPFVPAAAAASCPSVSSAALVANRRGLAWATPAGNLRISRVDPEVDRTHRYVSGDIGLDAGYGGLCASGSFPSGHTASVYEAGIALATLLPELAPSILARVSEAGNNRIALGVHYPLDVEGGRITGEIALADRWSDAAFRQQVLAPARAELVRYLTSACTAAMGVKTLDQCIAADTPYRDAPYAGAVVPGGTSQDVTDRASALRVYRWRLSYGFAPTTSTTLAPSVPAGAESLLITAFPTLTADQRKQVLPQTEVASGNPLDTSGSASAGGSWQRLDLAAAMTAVVRVLLDGRVLVVSTGGRAGIQKL